MGYINTGEAYLIVLFACAMLCPWYDIADTNNDENTYLVDRDTVLRSSGQLVPYIMTTKIKATPANIVCPVLAVDATCDGWKHQHTFSFTT